MWRILDFLLYIGTSTRLDFNYTVSVARVKVIKNTSFITSLEFIIYVAVNLCNRGIREFPTFLGNS